MSAPQSRILAPGSRSNPSGCNSSKPPPTSSTCSRPKARSSRSIRSAAASSASRARSSRHARHDAYLDRDFQAMTERVLGDIVARRVSQRSTRTYQIPGVDPITFEVVESPLVRDGRVWAIAGVGRDITQEVDPRTQALGPRRKRASRWSTSRSAPLSVSSRATSTPSARITPWTTHAAPAMWRSSRMKSTASPRSSRTCWTCAAWKAANFEVQSEVVDLAECVKFAVRHCEEEAERNEITLKIKLPEAPAPVYAPREAVVRVVLKSCCRTACTTRSTAAKSRSKCEEHEAYVEIAVRDNGVGIPEAELPYMFDKYYRGRTGGAPRAGHGTGSDDHPHAGRGPGRPDSCDEPQSGRRLANSASYCRAVRSAPATRVRPEYWKLSSNGTTAAAYLTGDQHDKTGKIWNRSRRRQPHRAACRAPRQKRRVTVEQDGHHGIHARRRRRRPGHGFPGGLRTHRRTSGECKRRRQGGRDFRQRPPGDDQAHRHRRNERRGTRAPPSPTKPRATCPSISAKSPWITRGCRRTSTPAAWRCCSSPPVTKWCSTPSRRCAGPAASPFLLEAEPVRPPGRAARSRLYRRAVRRRRSPYRLPVHRRHALQPRPVRRQPRHQRRRQDLRRRPDPRTGHPLRARHGPARPRPAQRRRGAGFRANRRARATVSWNRSNAASPNTSARWRPALNASCSAAAARFLPMLEVELRAISDVEVVQPLPQFGSQSQERGLGPHRIRPRLYRRRRPCPARLRRTVHRLQSALPRRPPADGQPLQIKGFGMLLPIVAAALLFAMLLTFVIQQAKIAGLNQRLDRRAPGDR